MESYLVDCLSLLVRWLHMITGIAWIGASFYFVMLDTSLQPPKKAGDIERGVFGELWAVHGGGFYHSQKFLTGPNNEPLAKNLHWSKWEAYTTWLSGIALLAIIYWYGAEIYLIDPSVMSLSKPLAISISIGFLIGAWLVYDLLCKSSLGSKNAVLGLVVFALVAVSAWGLCQLFSGRGAYMMFGAMLGTTMVANVFFVIIPGQRKMVDAIRAGEEVNPEHGRRGKQRSLHNTYFTLPVLFTMVSNHYAMTYGHEYNWAILIAISMAGALIRVFFVSRHGEGKPTYAALGVAIVLLIGVLVALKPASAPTMDNADTIALSQVQTIVSERCAVCHSATPSQAGFVSAPKGIIYDSAEQIKAQAASIYQQAVVTKVMPIGNLTGMTDDERTVISVWFAQEQNLNN